MRLRFLRLKLEYGEPVSNSAVKCNLRRYIMDAVGLSVAELAKFQRAWTVITSRMVSHVVCSLCGRARQILPTTSSIRVLNLRVLIYDRIL
jgi:exopolysaccharide biosynthesis predicted pyruvyltransferase EpsI